MKGLIKGEIMMSRKGIPAAKKSQFVHGNLAKLARLGDEVVSIHVLPDTGSLMKPDHSEYCRDFPIVTKGKLNNQSLIRKVLKRLSKRCVAMVVIFGQDSEMGFWSRISGASYFANQFLETAALLDVYKRKDVFERPLLHDLTGFRIISRTFYYLDKSTATLRDAETKEVEEEEEVLEDSSRSREDSRNSGSSFGSKATCFRSISLIRRELPESSLGWPLFRRRTLSNQEYLEKFESSTSVVEWVMNLPTRCAPVVNQTDLRSDQTSVFSNEGEILSTTTKDSSIPGDSLQDIDYSEVVLENVNRNLKDEDSDSTGCEDKEVVSSCMVSLDNESWLPYSMRGWPLLHFTASKTSDSVVESESEPRKLPRNLERFSKLSSLCCKQFTYGELKKATSQFYSENLIGEGGCSNVYKGCLPGGKLVAVKILKSYKEAWSDFIFEVDIVSSLKHKHIASLVGVCVENDHLISVYDFFPKGSLEGSLHGHSHSEIPVLPWGVRFKVAIAIAEALNYLHNESSRHVIHRDVKSSNILLSDDFQAKLSDFGLAIWGPNGSSYMMDSNVVGTFGYIAPDYLMQGKISDKTDMYSFGIVLLELLSGRKPICLVQWAKPLLKKGKFRELLDPELHGDFDDVQLHKLVLASSLCISQSARYRPKASQILKLLTGEKNPKEWYHLYVNDLRESGEEEDDCPHGPCLHIVHDVNSDFLHVNGDANSASLLGSINSRSTSSSTKKHRVTLKDYLREELD